MLETFGVYVRNILRNRLEAFLTEVNHSLGQDFPNLYNNIYEVCGTIEKGCPYKRSIPFYYALI